MTPRRVAFFTDSFHEVNGVALTSREFGAFGLHQSPISRRFGYRLRVPARMGALEPGARPCNRFALPHRKRLGAALAEFAPDLVHITGPSDAGILGAIVAHDLGLPLVASWHTNIHEFGARRLDRLLGYLPGFVRSSATRWFERKALDRCVRFYGLAKLLLAPNAELVEMLKRRTGLPTFLMTRGIDTELFSPAHRTRLDRDFVIGYVGRLSPEKNVRLLAGIERCLIQAGMSNYNFLIVGEGSECTWLRRSMQRADLPGVLRGLELARAYASMDAFVFSSSTDTFGNVVLEAMASGVTAIVAPEGGPKYLVSPGRARSPAAPKILLPGSCSGLAPLGDWPKCGSMRERMPSASPGMRSGKTCTGATKPVSRCPMMPGRVAANGCLA
jgi:glycosyltransferase involved in cell wall biosynthesis